MSRSRSVVSISGVLLLLAASACSTTGGLNLASSRATCVTVAGVLVGNSRTRVGRDLKDFKEQLTVLFIGMLFVILAADVRFAEIRALGTPSPGRNS